MNKKGNIQNRDKSESEKIYTRKITKVPDSPVHNGKANFGSFYGCFKNFKIKGLLRPFGDLAIPRFLTNTRVSGAMRFLFCDEKVIGEISFFSCFFFSFMETTFWLRDTNQKYAYRQYLPPGFIHLPKHIKYSVTACRKRRRYARIFSRFSHGKLHADLDFLARGTRPSCEARFDLDITGKNALDYAAVVPYFVSRRCLALYLQTGALKGWLSFSYKPDILLNKETSVGLFEIRKTYTGLKTKRVIVHGIGRLDGKMLTFGLSTSIAPDSYQHNENILLYEGKRTPLPPVTMTRPFGLMGKWIIQDTEGMVDLVFYPISQNYKKVNAIIFRTEYSTIYGTFEGMIKNCDGKEIKLKEFPGLIKKYNIRM